jgi:hypothetical protein
MGIDFNPVKSTSDIANTAIQVADQACQDINSVLEDIKPDSDLDSANYTTGSGTGVNSYGVKLEAPLSISSAAGAMVVDDLMQKISTKVQVAAQMLSAANNANKAATRIMSQG